MELSHRPSLRHAYGRREVVSAVAVAALLVAVSLLDEATGLFHLTVLYAVPIIIATWAFGLAGGLLAGVAAVLAVAVTHTLLHSPTLVADLATDITVFAFAAIVVDRLRSQLHTIASLEAQRDFDLGLARDIQVRMLGSAPADARYEAASVLDFAREVGGDYYRFEDVAGRLYLFAGDISGKGMSAALFSVLLDEAIGDALADGSSLETVVAAVNRRMYARMPPEMFVTMLFAVFDDEGVTFVNAGHVRPLVYRASERRAEEADQGGTLVLGVEPSIPSHPASIPLVAGDAVLVCSDGVTESRGLIRSPELLAATFATTAPDGPDAVVAAVAALAEREGQRDDVTVLCVRRR